MSQELDELYGRLGLCDAVIGLLKQENDPRAPDAVAYYQGQREELVRRIQACNPLPVVVSVNVGCLTARGGQG